MQKPACIPTPYTPVRTRTRTQKGEGALRALQGNGGARGLPLTCGSILLLPPTPVGRHRLHGSAHAGGAHVVQHARSRM